MDDYILTLEIIDLLGERQLCADRETDAIQKLNEIQSVYTYGFDSQRFDVGGKVKSIETIEFDL